jgi:hypothetical protein
MAVIMATTVEITKMIQLTFDPTDPAEVRRVFDLLPRFLTADPVVAALVDGEPDTELWEVRYARNLWRRINRGPREIVLAVRDHVPVGTTAPLPVVAAMVNRTLVKFRVSLNGGLRRAILSAKAETPGAEGELFVWKKNQLGRWELGMTQAMKDALADYTLADPRGDFVTIPHAQ